MTGSAPPRPQRRLAAGLLLAGWTLGYALGCALGTGPAAAQFAPAFVGFGALPVFAWPRAADDPDSRFAGSYARLSTGFEAVSSKRFGGYAGPTLGFEAGRMWQEGRFVYGISGGFDYLAAVGGGGLPGFGGYTYSRDFAGALQVKVGTLLTPDVLLYAKGGAFAVHETLRAGPGPGTPAFSREAVALRPNAQVGVEWAVTDRLTLAVEAGVVGGGFR